ncbi:MAG: polyphenol oxidase family protein [Elusimicrobia bacterium]|nr:polyphenol oxidase family protein [Elusimicrobiota bacterium]
MTVREWAERKGFLVNAAMSSCGLRHGVTTRGLGNMKDEGKRREAAASLGLAEPLVLKQVHGVLIHRAARSAQGAEGDGWILGPGDEGLCVAVYAADCMPLYLWTGDGRYAGVFHAGWRGMAEGMPTRAVAALVERGAAARSLRAAFGPHIGVDAYRVGPELEGRFPASSLPRRGDGLHLDLDADARRQLAAAGVPANMIGPAAPCTLARADAFYSFRRDKRDGRMLAMLALDRSRA